MSFADKFAGVFKEAGKDIPVTILPGVDHISLILDPVAIQAAVAAINSMDHQGPNQSMKSRVPLRTEVSVFATTSWTSSRFPAYAPASASILLPAFCFAALRRDPLVIRDEETAFNALYKAPETAGL